MRSRVTSAFAAAFIASACAGDLRQEAVAPASIWSEPGESYVPSESIAFADRGDGATYGLPRDGESGIADLLAIFPDDPLSGGDSDIFAAADTRFSTDQCRGGAPTIVPELPMTVEAVVTLHPRQYMKVAICGQDERHYGAFTVEDDTGGIVVLRDGRVTPYSFGDRVRLTVHAVTLTFGPELDTRAVLVADIEPVAGESEPVLFQSETAPFDSGDIARVKQVEGWVHVEPTNLNFNSMIVTSQPFSRAPATDSTGDMLQCERTCEVRCLEQCPSTEACADICPDVCLRGEAEFEPDDLPVCWMVGIDAELGRRGFAPEYGTRLRARGPVVNNFDVQMWVISPGQVERL